MKIGVIGIGDIAQKGYLPITTRLEDVELYLYTRNYARLLDTKKEYKSVNIVGSIDELIASDIDGVMIHAATEAHYDLCKIFLEKGVPVFVDKPVSIKFSEVEELYSIARQKDVLFRVGFNRRFSLFVDKTKNVKPDVIIYQKNRFDWPGTIEDYIFIDFIHVVDTVRFYLEDKIEDIIVKGHYNESLMYSLSVSLHTKRQVANLLMYRDSGKSEETIELFSKGVKYRITDLNSMVEHSNNTEVHHKLGDWIPILERRDFME